MRFYWFSILLAVFFSCGIRRLEKKDIYKELNCQNFLEMTDTCHQIIDVRTKGEFEESHIPGAINISYFSGQFKDIIDTVKFDKSKPVLIYCETQHRSLFVAKILGKKGFQSIIDLDKGMMRWRKNGFPYESALPSDHEPN